MNFVDIDTLVFAAPDMKAAKRFYTDWGLTKVGDRRAGAIFETGIGARLDIRPVGHRSLPPPAVPGMNFREAVWGVETQEDLDAVHREIARDREVTVDADGTIHCVDPYDIAVGFRVWTHEKQVDAGRSAINGYGDIERPDERAKIYKRARPIRMGHIGFALPDLKPAEKFYGDRLGFPISDRYSGGRGLFLRCTPEADHHNLFLIRSGDGGTAFHHVAFEVRDIHEVFGGGIYFDRKGWDTEVGPGRHPVSSAYFWYFKSPCEGAVEYFADSDYLTADWKPTAFRNNRFSEWHLVDGINTGRNAMPRPTMAADAGK